ncbi:glycoside hydrolase family 25 protein [Actinoallomurus soli]|uniref:glycoside hydrolase family 25 protein n=1 Tax=Actinoallomurus soli TaxID=2952535 RepID=UPI0020924B83|nr:glycoside hydrolase family 25 protein [Actinoallomurus soli]MCO5971783.1 glycoside hydrolase family 25 protein [Actinoallomurus soli]
MLHGFDISAYDSATAPAIDFVIVKATEGRSYTSSKFAAQWRSAKGRARHRGAYHFARPEDSSAASQAARFLSVVKPVPGESLWLDLEASDLGQAGTNAWAKAWGDYIRRHARGLTSGIYMGSGYASNGTGRGVARHYDLWWYPQYPSSARTSTWPRTFAPWLPDKLTCGWKEPDIWQFTDDFDGLDADITRLTIDRLAGGGHAPPPQEEMPQGGRERPGNRTPTLRNPEPGDRTRGGYGVSREERGRSGPSRPAW